MIVRTSSARPRHAPPPQARPGRVQVPPLDIPARRRRREAHLPQAPSGNTGSPTCFLGDKPTLVSTPRREPAVGP